MSTTNMLIIACVSFVFLTLSNILMVRAHGNTHPIGKLIKGTFVTYDDEGDEIGRLYICKGKPADYYFAFYVTNSGERYNYLTANGKFSKASIDYHGNTITPDVCYYQGYGETGQADSCLIDVVDLCDSGQITFSGTVNQLSASVDFVKISRKDELLGNEQIAPYQCGIPWDGDVSAEDTYPLALISGPLPWSPGGDGRHAQVFREDHSGCFADTLFDGSSANGPFGQFDVQRLIWDKKYWHEKWTDFSLPPDDACRTGTTIHIRVDRETVLYGWQCSDGETGSGYLLQKTDRYDRCPIFPPIIGS
eukprot:CAMPEP_0197030136 /NCGR_PEP_ID=MMETSP1384-20130603/9430_1 /TAXON_ID=29189 /ORGANISM="Ammonia sp." /LENGTH=305 /DNA_ID=CAMNT_0042459425 /DNA_START=48 /DNA_END=965 /DNA_ORIENTATION=+